MKVAAGQPALLVWRASARAEAHPHTVSVRGSSQPKVRVFTAGGGLRKPKRGVTGMDFALGVHAVAAARGWAKRLIPEAHERQRFPR